MTTTKVTIEVDKDEYEKFLRHKETVKNAQKKYAETHKDKMNEIRRRSYYKKKAEEDPAFLEREREKRRQYYYKKAEDPAFMEKERVRCRERYHRIKAEKVTKVFLPSVDEK